MVFVDSPIDSGTTTLHPAGGGAMEILYRDRDWSTTRIGDRATWPRSLQTALDVLLSSRFPGVIFWGPELCVLYNETYSPIFAKKHPDVLGATGREAWGEVWDVIAPLLGAVMEGGQTTWSRDQLLVLERNGFAEECYFTWSYSPIPDDHGGVGGVLTTIIETTENVLGTRRLRTLHSLGESVALARAVGPAAEAALQILASNRADIPFALLYVTSGHETARLAAATGLLPGQAASPETLTLAPARNAAWPLAAAGTSLHVVETGGILTGAESGPWPEPCTRAVIVPLRASNQDALAGWLVCGTSPRLALDDAYRSFLELVGAQVAGALTAARAHEDERARAEELAEIDRAKTAFFSNISHEFRTPLTLMLGPTEDALASPERALRGEALAAVHRNELRLLKLVNALLDFARIEAGRMEASVEATDLAELTTDLASAFRSAIEKAGLSFDVECAPLGELVFVDRDMWEKIVLNLLSNALKFTFAGSVRLTLRLDGGDAQLHVRDTGTGIAKSELPHVFERFHRVSGAPSRTHEGSGIGLALAFELVRMHGGTLEVESEVGVGSTFTVRIPRGSGHFAAERIRTPDDEGSPASTANPFVEEASRWLPATEAGVATEPAHEENDPIDAGGRILLADDNADMREYIVRILQPRWTVEAVADGAAALASARRSAPALVLTDVMMPELDGFGLMRALRAEEQTARVPVVMLSARAGEEARVEGLEAGADDYLVKPFSARELVARVATHVQLARLRRDAEEERQKLYGLLMTAPVAIAVVVGPLLRFAVANPAYCEMMAREGIVGRPLLEAFPELDAVSSVARRVFETGTTARLEEVEVLLERRGQRASAYFALTAEPLREADAIIGVIIVANEVTEQILARRHVDSLRAAAEEASRAKDEFLNVLSHELRTPLNAIVGWSAMLRSGSVSPTQAPKALETIERNGRIQARLIEDMLDLSRIEQGKLVLSVGPVEMTRVVHAALDTVRPAADAKGIRLQPVLDSHAVIVGDVDRLQQIVWNLVSNAIKFTPRGGRVQVRLRREPSHVELTVADDGQGIEAAFLPHVFDRFRQNDASSTRRTGGLGLGLAIVKSLVELHGGVVSAFSDGPGAGATFVVKLPMAPLRADQAKASAPEPGVRGAPTFECPPVLSGKRVLMVDDEPETRELIRFVVEQCGCHVVTAASGAAALDELSQGTFDLIISDVGMPMMDGIELIQKIRSLATADTSAIPAVALTAYARIEDRTRALRAGFDMHLAKPIEPSELIVVLGALLSRRRR